jgi:hypothetical protein
MRNAKCEILEHKLACRLYSVVESQREIGSLQFSNEKTFVDALHKKIIELGNVFLISDRDRLPSPDGVSAAHAAER